MLKEAGKSGQSVQANSRSAYKALEMVLYSLDHQVNDPLLKLVKSSEKLDNTQRFQVTHLQEAVSRIELLIKDVLKTDTNKVDNNADSHTEPGLVERIQVEKVLRTLATTTSSQDSEEFFNYCVKTLAELYRCKFAFIGIIKPNGKEVQTLAVRVGDHFAQNFEYDLGGTPCADIISLKKELIPTNAQSLYPDDHLLVDMNIDSYFGAPLLTKDRGVIGLVSVMDDKPMELNEWTAPVLGVFASRLTLEMQRKMAVEELYELNATLEKRINERTFALEESNRELTEFTSSVAHDLRAPVRVINSFVDIIFEDYFENIPGGCKDYLNRIKGSGLKLNRLIDDLLQLAQVGKQDMSLKRVDISALALDEFQALDEVDKARQVKSTIHSDMKAWGDEGLVRIILQNLIGNAWKYTSTTANASIEIGSLGEGKNTVYYVRDNGVGFSMEFSDKLFRPFERLHSEEQFEGNGVGLATTMRIIKRHSGKLWAESQPNEGAVFYFTLGQSQPIIPKP